MFLCSAAVHSVNIAYKVKYSPLKWLVRVSLVFPPFKDIWSATDTVNTSGNTFVLAATPIPWHTFLGESYVSGTLPSTTSPTLHVTFSTRDTTTLCLTWRSSTWVCIAGCGCSTQWESVAFSWATSRSSYKHAAMDSRKSITFKSGLCMGITVLREGTWLGGRVLAFEANSLGFKYQPRVMSPSCGSRT